MYFWMKDVCTWYPFISQHRYRSIHGEWYCHNLSYLYVFSLNRHHLQKRTTYKKMSFGRIELKVIQLRGLFTNPVEFQPIPKQRGQLLKIHLLRQKLSIFSKGIQIRWLLFQRMTLVWTEDFSNALPSQMILQRKQTFPSFFFTMEIMFTKKIFLLCVVHIRIIYCA